MNNPEIDLGKKLRVRQLRLKEHEELRLQGDYAKDHPSRNQSLSQIARTTYEKTVWRSDIWSSSSLREKTKCIIKTWIESDRITQEQGNQFLEKTDLGYAGETRISTVAANCRAKQGIATSVEDANKWRETALERIKKHTLWQSTIDRVNKTLTGDPIIWNIEITNDLATVLTDEGKFYEAALVYKRSFYQAMTVFTDSFGEPNTAAASGGGVARVKQARLMFDLYKKELVDFSLKDISQIFEQGRDFVHLSGMQNLNYERSRVIEMWYTQFLLQSKQYLKIPGTFTTWLWLFKNHEGTREMAKDRIKTILEKAKDRVFEPGLYAQM